DFLRSVKHFQDNPQKIIDLEPYLPKDWNTTNTEDSANTLNTLLLADKLTNEPDDSEEKKQPPKSVQFVQSPAQTETQHRVLIEAAIVGLEMLGKSGHDEWRLKNEEQEIE
ncbi:MAG: hypothetical protein LBI18_12725, partial [Planctomycetaceae bacterium]|nr:hypothetical protein [Planctomycetaceae bacterium]